MEKPLLMEKFIISQIDSGKFQFSLLSKMGAVILTSDGLSSREECHSQIGKIRKFSQERQRFDKQLLVTGKFFFNLEATNGCIIAFSPLFDHFSDMVNGIDCVIKYGQAAYVEDLTVYNTEQAHALQFV